MADYEGQNPQSAIGKSFRRLKLLRDHDAQFLGWKRFEGNFAPVKKHCRSAFDAQRVAALPVLKDPLSHDFAVHVAFVTVYVQPNLFGVTLKNRPDVELVLPVWLMFVDQIVHLPELTLQSRGFGGGRRSQRMLMCRHEGKLAERDAQAITKLCMHLLEYRMKQPARRTLEITKLFEVRRC